MSNEQFETIMNQMKVQEKSTEELREQIKAQDEKFTKQINALDKKITNQGTILNKLVDDVETLKTDVAYLKEDMFNVKENVAKIRPEVIYIRRTQEEAIKKFNREVAINKKEHGDILHIVDERDLMAEEDRKEIHKEIMQLKAKIG